MSRPIGQDFIESLTALFKMSEMVVFICSDPGWIQQAIRNDFAYAAFK